jgi:hypothetical protein
VTWHPVCLHLRRSIEAVIGSVYVLGNELYDDADQRCRIDSESSGWQWVEPYQKCRLRTHRRPQWLRRLVWCGYRRPLPDLISWIRWEVTSEILSSNGLGR